MPERFFIFRSKQDTPVACLRSQNGALGTVIGPMSTYPVYPAELQLAGEHGSAVITKGTLIAWFFVNTDPIDEKCICSWNKEMAVIHFYF